MTSKSVAFPARRSRPAPLPGRGGAHDSRATIADVARLCGVSKGTVSKAISNHTAGEVASDTRQRVLAAAAKLGYRANSFARALAQRKTRTIGLVFNRTTPMLFGAYEPLASAVADALRRNEYHLLFIPLYGRPDEVHEILADQRVDGCLAMQPADTAMLAALNRFALPSVLINERADGSFCQVLVDDAGGTQSAVSHLFDLGHRRIVYYHGPHVGAHYSYSLRERAFLDAMRLADASGGARVFVGTAEELLAAVVTEERPATAVISHNSLVGFDVLCACWRRQLRVPDRLSLLCFDDVEPLRRSVPAPTVVDVPLAQAGRRAAELLLAHLEDGRPLPDQPIVLPEQLIVRESTGPVTGR